MKLRAVLFDLDNTLMDRDHTFKSFAEQLVDECLESVNSGTRQRLVDYMIESDADGYRSKDGYFQELIDNLPWSGTMTMSRLKEYYSQHYMSHAKVMNYAMDAIEACKINGLKLGIITNGISQLQHGKIDRLELRNHFDTIVVSGDIEIKKPDKRIYLTALDQLGVTAEETVIIGDHPRNDIWGAAQVGIKGVWLRRKHVWSSELDDGAPWKIIDELNELSGIIVSNT